MSWLDAAADLLEVARSTLREKIAPGLDAGGRHEAAMVANAMAIALRELEQGASARTEEQVLLAEFYGTPAATLPELRRRLCRDLRDGAALANRSDELRALLHRVVYARLAISNPDYARTHPCGAPPTETRMPDSYASTRPAEIAAFVGKHYIYTYDNGWQYETYIKNERHLDYRVHSGIVAGRWVKDQEAHIVRLAEGVFRASWVEPTGTGVSLAINFGERRVHGTIFFPRWVVEAPQKIAIFQNPRIAEMLACRDAGPTYPIEVVDSFATITFVEDRARDDETVIACGPEALPAGYAARRN